MATRRTLAAVERDIHDWIARSGRAMSSYLSQDDRLWVLKFFPPKYLAGFLRRPELVVSTSAGFTWGDGVYVVPEQHVYSAMIYGRVGVRGWIAPADCPVVYDAGDPAGVGLYQEWIQFKPGLFTLLTTTVHANLANRRLRNAFRTHFKIDVVVFRPDEFNRAYVQPSTDRWFVISDFGAAATGGTLTSQKVRECELVVIGTEEFALSASGVIRNDLLGAPVSPPGLKRVPGSRPDLGPQLATVYNFNRSRGGAPLDFLVPRP